MTAAEKNYDIHDLHILRGGDVDGDRLALAVLARVAARDGDDGRGEAVLDADGHAVEVVPDAGEHDLGEVGLRGKQGEQRLSLWVAAPDVVLEDLGARGGHHQAGEEDADHGIACSID
ncbi:hypothetical protein KEM55_004137 [Ascosphaera atra]|nr:hypothetical protein KEM55_004137 [Ascosphaera atra]